LNTCRRLDQKALASWRQHAHLIAEDDQVLADGLLRSLRASGYAVDQVSSGSEADAALASHEFDC
jgi:DNA-binding response OmpR family regulator